MNKKNAFTLAEILIAISIIGVMVVLVLTTFINSNKMSENKLTLLSRQISLILDSNYLTLLEEHSSTFSLLDLNEGQTSASFRDAFISYFDGTKDNSCNNLVIPQELSAILSKNNFSCIDLDNKFTVGFYLDSTGTIANNKNIIVKTNYTKDETEGRRYANSGVYGLALYNPTKNSQGTIGHDSFIYAFGKSKIIDGDVKKK